ncbi:MAG: nitroreductase family protein, partial [Thermovirgaceae bacterium]|nr:nitroreductase family protein [Thermovirgaceae bacterium]
ACLTEKNASWVQNAPLLAFQIMRETFEYNGKPNPWSGFDCGLAMGQLILQAESMGWSVHVMAGFSRDRVREAFRVPEGFNPLVAFVIGIEGDPDTLPEDMKVSEMEPRERKPLEETVFSASWSNPMF